MVGSRSNVIKIRSAANETNYSSYLNLVQDLISEHAMPDSSNDDANPNQQVSKGSGNVQITDGCVKLQSVDGEGNVQIAVPFKRLMKHMSALETLLQNKATAQLKKANVT